MMLEKIVDWLLANPRLQSVAAWALAVMLAWALRGRWSVRGFCGRCRRDLAASDGWRCPHCSADLLEVGVRRQRVYRVCRPLLGVGLVIVALLTWMNVARWFATGGRWYDLAGVLEGAFLLAVIPVMVLVLVRPARLHRRTGQPPLCAQCGYNLTGLTVPRCPECGKSFIEAGIVFHPKQRPRSAFDEVALVVLLIVLVLLMWSVML